MQGRPNPDRQMLDAEAFCRGLVEEGTIYAYLADYRGELLQDGDFADLFPSGRGRPSIAVDVVCSVMVLQALEGLSDRDAIRALSDADRLEGRLRPGARRSGLRLHESHLLARPAPQLWPSRTDPRRRPPGRRRDRRAEKKHRRALDSTILDDAVATQDTVTQIISAIRRVRAEIPRLEALELGQDYSTARKPVIDWSDAEVRDGLVSALVKDATTLLDAVDDEAPDQDQADALGLLALVSAQGVEPGERRELAHPPSGG